MQRTKWVCAAAVGVSLVLRGMYLWQPWWVDCATLPLWLGDEGSTAILALHILRGARPLLMSGAYHLGTLDPYLTAISFGLFGTNLLAVRLVSHAGALLSALLAYLIARKIGGARSGLLAATLVILPSPFVFVWSAMSLVPYASFAATILFVLYTTLLVLERPGGGRWMLAGFAWGLGVWNSLLAGAYVAVCAGVLAFSTHLRRKDIVALGVGLIVGASPLICANIHQPLVSVAQLARKARHSVSMVQDVRDQGRREYRAYPLLQVMGAQGEGSGSWSALGMVGALFLGAGLAGGAWHCCTARKPQAVRQQLLLLGFVAVGVLEGLAGFSGQPIGRYQLPLFPVLVIVATGWVGRVAPRLSTAIVGAVALCNAIAITTPPSCEGVAVPGDIITVLKEKGLRHGYAAGQMYDLMLRSNEEIVVVPLEHSRFPSDEALVGAAERIFYVFRTDQQDKRIHQVFMDHLRERQVRYEELAVENFRILYNFAPREALSAEAIAGLIEEFRRARWGDQG